MPALRSSRASLCACAAETERGRRDGPLELRDARLVGWNLGLVARVDGRRRDVLARRRPGDVAQEIAMHDRDRRTGEVGEVGRERLGNRDRSMAAAGAADGDREVALSLAL